MSANGWVQLAAVRKQNQVHRTMYRTFMYDPKYFSSIKLSLALSGLPQNMLENLNLCHSIDW